MEAHRAQGDGFAPRGLGDTVAAEGERQRATHQRIAGTQRMGHPRRQPPSIHKGAVCRTKVFDVAGRIRGSPDAAVAAGEHRVVAGQVAGRITPDHDFAARLSGHNTCRRLLSGAGDTHALVFEAHAGAHLDHIAALQVVREHARALDVESVRAPLVLDDVGPGTRPDQHRVAC